MSNWGKGLHDQVIGDRYISWLNKKEHQLTKDQVKDLAKIVEYEAKKQFNLNLDIGEKLRE